MYKSVFLIILLISLISFHGSSQDFNVVPKDISIEAGTRYSPYSDFNSHTFGWNVQLDMAWQVSGFKNKKAAYISVPMGFSQFHTGGGSGKLETDILYYGWTIIHNLSYNRTWIPFISYSLLLNQLWLEDKSGRTMGHETRFDLGYNYHPEDSKLIFLVKLEYSHIIFPSLDSKDSNRMEIFALKTGIRF